MRHLVLLLLATIPFGSDARHFRSGADQGPDPRSSLLSEAGNSEAPDSGRLSRLGVNVGHLPWGDEKVHRRSEKVLMGPPPVGSHLLGDSKLAAGQKDQPETASTVEELAALHAARKAQRQAAEAEAQTAVLRKEMQKKVESLQHRIREMQKLKKQGLAREKLRSEAKWVTVPFVQRKERHDPITTQKVQNRILHKLVQRPNPQPGGVSIGSSKRSGKGVGGNVALPLPPYSKASASALHTAGDMHQERDFLVIQVSREEDEILVSAPNNGVFRVGPDRFVLTFSDGGEQILPYSSVFLVKEGLRFKAPPGVRYAADASYASPSPQRRFMVMWMSSDRQQLHLDCQNDGTFAPGPGYLRVTLSSGNEQIVGYSSLSVALALDQHSETSNSKEMKTVGKQRQPVLVLHAFKDCAFPPNAVYGAPLAGSFWASEWHQGDVDPHSIASSASKPIRVDQVSNDGSVLLLPERAADILAPAPARILVENQICGIGEYLYASMRSSGSWFDSGHVALHAGPNYVFPKDSKQVLIPSSHQPLFTVFWRSESGDKIRVQAPNDDTFSTSYSRVVVQRKDGTQALYPIKSAEPAVSDEDGPSGFLIEAKAGSFFPDTVVKVGPVKDAFQSEHPLQIQYLDTESRLRYHSGTGLAANSRLYVDREYVFTYVPPQLQGQSYIVTAEEDVAVEHRSMFLTFWLNRPSDVYILFDSDAFAAPRWLEEGFLPLPLKAETNRGELRAWKSKAPLAGPVYLGGSSAEPARGVHLMYSVVVAPASATIATPPSVRVAEQAQPSLQYPVLDVWPDQGKIRVEAFNSASFKKPANKALGSIQIQRSDGSLAKCHYLSMASVDTPTEIPALDFKVSSECDLPTDAVGVSPAPDFPVLFLSSDYQVLRVGAENKGIFSQGPGRIKLVYGANLQRDFRYASVRATIDGMEFKAPPGLAFPPGSVGAAPGAQPVTALASYVSRDGKTIRLTVGSDWAFPPPPSQLRVVTADGTVVTVTYIKMVHSAEDVNGPPGLQFTAAKDSTFPLDARRADALAYPVLSVKPDGMQIVVQVPGAKAFPPGPCVAQIATFDGDHASVEYASAALLPTPSSGLIQILLTAQQGATFPQMPGFAKPICKVQPFRTYQVRPVLFQITEISRPSIPGVTTGALKIKASAGVFSATGGYIKVYSESGDISEFPYTACHPLSDSGEWIVKLEKGVVVPEDATQVAPSNSKVMAVADDGSLIQVAAPNDGAWLPGPGKLVGVLANGKEVTLKYESLAELPPGSPAGGLLFSAAEDTRFPTDLNAVRPAPYESISNPLPSQVLEVRKDGEQITILPKSSFPSRGTLDVTKADGSSVKVFYSRAFNAPAAMQVALSDGSFVSVPTRNVKHVPGYALVTMPNGRKRKVEASSVKETVRDPKKTLVDVTMPDGEHISVPESDIAVSKSAPRMLYVVLPDAQKIEVPATDVQHVPSANIVTLPDGATVKVPSSAIQRSPQGSEPGTVLVQLPDGRQVTLPRQDVSAQIEEGDSFVSVRLSNDKLVKVRKSQVLTGGDGIPAGMVKVLLPDGREAVVRAEDVGPSDGGFSANLMQIKLPNNIYALVEAKDVTLAPPVMTVRLPGDETVDVPNKNVHRPPDTVTVTFRDGKSAEVLPESVEYVAPHIQVLLPDGKRVRLSSKDLSVSEQQKVETDMILQSAPGSTFPSDAEFVSPGEDPPLEVIGVTPDGIRMTVLAPPGIFSPGPSRVQLSLRTGKRISMPYARAIPYPGQAAGPMTRVVRVSNDGSWLEVDTPTALPAPPGRMYGVLEGGHTVSLPYVRVEPLGNNKNLLVLAPAGTTYPSSLVQIASQAAHRVILVARDGLEFPQMTVGVLPARNPGSTFLVVGVSVSGDSMRIECPDDGTIPPGPGVIRLHLEDGQQQLAAYDSISTVVPDEMGPAGLIVYSPSELSFPHNTVLAEPTSGFGHSGSDVKYDEGMPPVTDAVSKESLGPACPVLHVEAGGVSATVGPYGLFLHDDTEVEVHTSDGTSVRIHVHKVLDRNSASQVCRLLASSGNKFPGRAISVQPVLHRSVGVGQAVVGTELYADDPTHVLAELPPRLTGLPYVQTDNSAKADAGQEVLTFTVWGWSKLFVLRPDSRCDYSVLPYKCSYITDAVPTWLTEGFRPRPDLYVASSDGTLAVFESKNPVQGRISLGGNNRLPPTKLVLSHLISRGVRPYKIVKAHSSDGNSGTFLYVDTKDTRLIHLPPLLEGADLIQTAAHDAGSVDPDFLSFELSCPSDCYVLRDNTEGYLPHWLENGFEKEPGLVAETTSGPMQIMRSKLPLLGRAIFGGNQGGRQMYAVICVPSPARSSLPTEEPVSVVGIRRSVWSEDTAEVAKQDLIRSQVPEQVYVGRKLYLDSENVRFLRVPDQLAGATMIRTLQGDKDLQGDHELSFNVSEPSQLFILRDDSAPRVWFRVVATVSAGDGIPGAPPSKVLFLSPDRTRMRLKASTHFFPGPGEVAVTEKDGTTTTIKYIAARKVEAEYPENEQNLVPGGMELVAAPGYQFPKSSTVVVPAQAAATDVSGIVAIASIHSFGSGPGELWVSTKSGNQFQFRFSRLEKQAVPKGDPPRVVIFPAPGEAVPEDIEAVSPTDTPDGVLPQWLADDFTHVDMLVRTTAGEMHVYKSRHPVRGRVVLGGNSALPGDGSEWGNYVVALLPIQSRKEKFDVSNFHHLGNYGVIVSPVEAGLDYAPSAAGSLFVGSELVVGPKAMASSDLEGVLHKLSATTVVGATMERQDRTVSDSQLHVVSQYPVVGVQDDGKSIQVQVPAVDGHFESASEMFPRRMEIISADGQRADYSYTAVFTQEGMDPRIPPVLVFSAAHGTFFPQTAVAASPASEFLVDKALDKGQKLLVSAPNNGLFVPGGHVKAKLPTGLETEVPIGDVQLQNGLLLVAAAGKDRFPAGVLTVGPAAEPPPGTAWGLPEIKYRVVGVSEDANILDVHVDSEDSIEPGPGSLQVVMLDDSHKEYEYQTVAFLPTGASGRKVAQISGGSGTRYPKAAAYVIPSGETHARPIGRTASAEFGVLHCEVDKMLVDAPNDGTFPPGPNSFWVQRSNGGPIRVHYSSVAVSALAHDSDELPEAVAPLVFVVKEGTSFPLDAQFVAPAFSLVISSRGDGSQLQVLAPNNGIFPPGPAKMTIKLPDGSTIMSSYASVAKLPGNSPAGGLLLTAVENNPFPKDARSVLPTGPEQYAICQASADGTEVRINAPDNGAFSPAPALVELLLRRENGSTGKKMVEYSALAPVAADSSCPKGLIMKGSFQQGDLADSVSATPIKDETRLGQSVVQSVHCPAAMICRQSLLRSGSPVFADSVYPKFEDIPDAFEDLEYVRSADVSKLQDVSASMEIDLRRSSDVYVLIPDRQVKVVERFSIASLENDGKSMRLVVPVTTTVPGPFFPDGPWEISVENSHGKKATIPYQRIKLEKHGDARSGEGDVVSVEAMPGSVFPAWAQFAAPLPGTPPPGWLSRDFSLTNSKIRFTDGVFQVYKSKIPMQGQVSFGSLIDVAAPYLELVKAVHSHSSDQYRKAFLRPGADVYVDSSTKFVDVPSELAGSVYVQSASADSKAKGDDFLTFNIQHPADVFVMFDNSGSAMPRWLTSGFEKTQMTASTSSGDLSVWKSKQPLVGETKLGGNDGAGSMYIALCKQVQPAGESASYVVALKQDLATEPIGMESAFGRSDTVRRSEHIYPSLSDLAVYSVASVEDQGHILVVHAPRDAPFVPRIGVVELTKSDGLQIHAMYSSVESLKDAEFAVQSVNNHGREIVVIAMGEKVVAVPPGAGTVHVKLPDEKQIAVPVASFTKIPKALSTSAEFLLTAEHGYRFPEQSMAIVVQRSCLKFVAFKDTSFPADAKLVAPAAQYPVTGIAPDGTRMRIAAPSDGTFQQGPSEIRVQLLNQKEIPVAYSHVEVVPADLAEPAGLLFVSRPEEVFPHDAILVGPAVGPSLTLTNVEVTTKSNLDYDVSVLGIGRKVYGDSPDVFVDMPDTLLGQIYVRCLEADKSSASQSFLKFVLNKPAYVVILVPSPQDKVSWVPYWYPDLIGKGSTEKLPGWIQKDFTHTGMEVLSNTTRFEVFVSKQKISGLVVLGGNEAVPSVGSRDMYVVAIAEQNITASADSGFRHSTFKVEGKGTGPETSSEFWEGAMPNASLPSISYFPVLNVNLDEMVISAPRGSFPSGPGTVWVQAEDGSLAMYQISSALSIHHKHTSNAFKLFRATGNWPISASYVRLAPPLPLYKWQVTSVSPAQNRMVVEAPRAEFPDSVGVVMVSRPGGQPVDVPIHGVEPIASSMAVILHAAGANRFPKDATFVAAEGPATSLLHPLTISNIVPSPQSRMQYDVSTLGVGKRVHTDRDYLFTKVPLFLAGSPYILTPEIDSTLTDEMPRSCAVSFELTKEAYVYIGLRPTKVKVCSGGPEDCRWENTDPIWLHKFFTTFKDEAGNLATITISDGISRTLFKSRRAFSGTVCLGGRSSPRAFNMTNNYVVIASAATTLHQEHIVHPLMPTWWDDKPLKFHESKGLKWHAITARSVTGSQIRVYAHALGDGFQKIEPTTQTKVVIRSCDGSEGPYSVTQIVPVAGTAYAPHGIELSASAGETFPSCASYARPWVEHYDAPRGAHGPGLDGSAWTRFKHGEISFEDSSLHADAADKYVMVNVTRQKNDDGPVSVRYYTADGSAHESRDYKEKSGTLIWGDGEMGSRMILIPLSGMPWSPQQEQSWTRFFTVTLTDPSGGAVLVAPTILNVRIYTDGSYSIQDNSKDTVDEGEAVGEVSRESLLPWQYPITSVTRDGKYLRVLAPREAPLSPTHDLLMQCNSGKKEYIRVRSVSSGAPKVFTVVGVGSNGYEMILGTGQVAIPAGPGKLSIATADGRSIVMAYGRAEPVEGQPGQVNVYAPSGFPFPHDTVSVAEVHNLLLESLPHERFPSFSVQSEICECSLSPAPAGRYLSSYPVTHISPSGLKMRAEAPADSHFSPQGKVKLVKADGTEQLVAYQSVHVLSPAEFAVTNEGRDDGSLEVKVEEVSFPSGPGKLLVKDRNGRVVLVQFSHSRPSSKAVDNVEIYATPGDHFPADPITVEVASSGLMFTAAHGTRFPTDKLHLPVADVRASPQPLSAGDDVGGPGSHFPITHVSEDGKLMRIQAPSGVGARAHGILRIQDDSGNVYNIGFQNIARVEPEVYKVLDVIADGSSVVVEVDETTFSPGPGKIIVTTATSAPITIKYDSAVAMEHSHRLVRISAAQGHKIPKDAEEVELATHSFVVHCANGQRFPSAGKAEMVADWFAQILPLHHDNGFFVIDVQKSGAMIHLAASPQAALSPAGAVDIHLANGAVKRFRYDRIDVAPSTTLPILQSLEEGSRMLIQPNGIALPPSGVLTVHTHDGKSVPVPYDNAIPNGETGLVAVSISQGSTVPDHPHTASLHPPGLLLVAPSDEAGGASKAHIAGGAVADSRAWVLGGGPTEYAVTSRSADGRSLIVQAPPTPELWVGEQQWSAKFRFAGGKHIEWPIKDVRVVPDTTYRITHVDPSGSTAIVQIDESAIPAAPGDIWVLSADGEVTRSKYELVESGGEDLAANEVRLHMMIGHLLPLNSVSFNTVGTLELISDISAPFSLEFNEQLVSFIFASPGTSVAQGFPVCSVSNGKQLSIAVPPGAHPFKGQKSGTVHIKLQDGSSEEFKFSDKSVDYGEEFNVLWVEKDGSVVVILAKENVSFPAGPGTVYAKSPSGQKKAVAFSEASLFQPKESAGNQVMISITAEAGTVFPTPVVQIATETMMRLHAAAQTIFPADLADSTISDAFASPLPAEISDDYRRSLVKNLSHAITEVTKAPHPAVQEYPFSFPIVQVANSGRDMLLFVPDVSTLSSVIGSVAHFEVGCAGKLHTSVANVGLSEQMRSQEFISPVKSVDPDGGNMIVLLDFTQRFPPGPGILSVELSDGQHKTVPYQSAATVDVQYSDSNRDIVIAAPEGLPFPLNAVKVLPFGRYVRLHAVADEFWPMSFLRNCAARPYLPTIEQQKDFDETPRMDSVVPAPQIDSSQEANREWAWLKPHPSISSLTSGEFQFSVGVMGLGKVGYVDRKEVFTSLPEELIGRPYIVPANADRNLSSFSFSIDEASDIYLIVPHPAKRHTKTGMLSWLPFELSSLFSSNHQTLPAWMGHQFKRIPEMKVKIGKSTKFHVFKSKTPTVGSVVLGRPVGEMYIPVLVPAENSVELVPIRAGIAAESRPEVLKVHTREVGQRGRVKLRPDEVELLVRQCGDAEQTRTCLQSVQSCTRDLDIDDPQTCRCFSGRQRECSVGCLQGISAAFQSHASRYTSGRSLCPPIAPSP